MLPGFKGHLLSAAFVEGQLSAIAVPVDTVRLRRELLAWRARSAMLGPASTPRTILQTAAPLCAALGFDAPAAIEPAPPAVAATLRAGSRAVALLVAAWGEPLDPLWRLAVGQAGRRSAPWCLLFDGLHLRIVDASRLYARRHVEFDLDLAIDHPPSLAALWAVMGSPSLTAQPDEARSLHALVAASDRHAAGVCRSLRDGVLAASGEVLRRVGRARTVRRTSGTRFEQSLTIVYRILFLLFAEARALVPLWHPIYRESYSLESLRDLAERATRASGLWDAVARDRPPGPSRLPRGRSARHTLQRTPVRAGSDAARRAPRSGRRGRQTSRHGAVDAARAGSRGTRAHRLPGSRRRAARRRVRDVARLRAARGWSAGQARVRVRPPQGDRDVLYPAADRRLRRAPDARAAGT
jgi:hypothetical protein